MGKKKYNTLEGQFETDESYHHYDNRPVFNDCCSYEKEEIPVLNHTRPKDVKYSIGCDVNTDITKAIKTAIESQPDLSKIRYEQAKAELYEDDSITEELCSLSGLEAKKKVRNPRSKNSADGIMVIYMDVGQLSPQKAEAFIQRYKEEWKSALSRVPNNYEVMFVPRRNEPTEIDLIKF